MTAVAVCTDIVYCVLRYSDRMLFRVRSCKVKKEKMINHLKNIIPKRVHMYLFSLKLCTGYKKTNKLKKILSISFVVQYFFANTSETVQKERKLINVCIHGWIYIAQSYPRHIISHGILILFYITRLTPYLMCLVRVYKPGLKIFVHIFLFVYFQH